MNQNRSRGKKLQGCKVAELGSGHVTPLAFGSAPIGDLYRPIPVAEAVETVQFALANGITLFDTAPLYGLGLAEERVGLALQGVPRNDYTLSTKIGRVLNDDSDYHLDFGILKVSRYATESI